VPPSTFTTEIDRTQRVIAAVFVLVLLAVTSATLFANLLFVRPTGRLAAELHKVERFSLVLVGLQLKHLVADYLLQPRWVIHGKGDVRKIGGYVHAGLRAVGTPAGASFGWAGIFLRLFCFAQRNSWSTISSTTPRPDCLDGAPQALMLRPEGRCGSA
jgi:hypothetical protein